MFPVALPVVREPICAGIVAMCAGVAGRLLGRPDLASKTLVGARLFECLYLMLLASMARLEPGYVDRVRGTGGMLRGRVAELPVSEILFGVSFGAYWSGLDEHWHWTFARRRGAPGCADDRLGRARG